MNQWFQLLFAAWGSAIIGVIFTSMMFAAKRADEEGEGLHHDE